MWKNYIYISYLKFFRITRKKDTQIYIWRKCEKGFLFMQHVYQTDSFCVEQVVE